MNFSSSLPWNLLRWLRQVTSVVALLATLLVSSSPVAIAQVAAPAAPALEFRHEESAASGKAPLGFAFVALIAAAAWGGILYLRRSGRLPAAAGAGADFKVIQMRKLSPRLTVVAIRIEGGETVVFADNGQSMLTLANLPARPAATTVPGCAEFET